MSHLGRADEEFDGLMQVSLSKFCPFEQSRARANLKSKFMYELRFSSLPIITLNAEYVVLLHFTKVKAKFFELLNCVWQHSLYFTTACTP